MELPHLRSFLVLADELHFGRAADQLGLTQPSLSRQIQQLEATLGVSLFDRSGKTVQLTRAGNAFRQDARHYVDGLQDAVAKVRRIAAGHTGELRVAFPSNLATVLMPKIVERLRRSAREVVLTLREMSVAAHEEALRSGEVDVTLSTLPMRDLGLTQRFLFSEALVAMVKADHPRARQEKISLQELRSETFLMCPTYRTSGFHEAVLERFKAVGFTPRVGQETDSKVLLAELIAGGAGVAIVPESSTQLVWRGVAYRPLAEALEPLRVGAVWVSENENPARAAFVAAAVDVSRALIGQSEALAS